MVLVIFIFLKKLLLFVKCFLSCVKYCGSTSLTSGTPLSNCPLIYLRVFQALLLQNLVRTVLVGIDSR